MGTQKNRHSSRSPGGPAARQGKIADAGRSLNRRELLALGAGASAAFAFPAPAIAQAQTLTVWSGFPELEPFYRRVGESLKARNPNLTVNVQPIPLREHERRVALALPAGSAADIIEFADSTAQRYLEAGLIAKAPDPVAAFVRNPTHFDPYFTRAASYDGAVYGVPLFRGQGSLYYNTDMFAAAGLTRPPQTMEEYTEYASKLVQREASGRPTVTGWSLRLSGGGQGIAEKFWINMHQYGGALVRQAAGGKWVTDYANEAGRKTLQQYLDNVHVKKNCALDSPADAEAFQRGQTAMFIRESWVIGDIAKKAPNLKYSTALLPTGTIVVPVQMYTPARNPRAELAWTYMQAANEPAHMAWLLENVGWLPNRKDVDYSPVVTKIPQMKSFVEFPASYKLFGLPTIGPSEEILTRLAERLVRAFGNAALATDAAGIDRFLKDAATETESILSREGLLGSR
jgi:multiple sugar transport system substrate-binding protein